MRNHGGPPSRRDKHVTLAAISPPGVARGRFVGGQKSGLAGCKPPPLFTRRASSCSSQGRRQGEPWGASPRPSAPTYLPGASISIVAKKTLPCGSLKNTMTTAAMRIGDGHVVHSCGDCEVEVPMGSRTIAHRFYVMDTEAFHFVLGTDFSVQHSQIQSLTLQVHYLLYVDHGNGRESVPLEQLEHTWSYLRVWKEEPWNMMVASKTEDYQLLGEVLDQGLKELGYSREDLSVESFASDKQHVLDLYCSKGKNCGYKFYWPSFGMAYGNPRFSELGKVLTKVALERSRMVLCSPDWGAHGGNEYSRTLLDRLTISSVRLPDEAIYLLLGRKTPIWKPRWGSMSYLHPLGGPGLDSGPGYTTRKR